MNPWLWILMGILIFAPKGDNENSGRLDLRAVALLLCIIAVVAQI